MSTAPTRSTPLPGAGSTSTLPQAPPSPTDPGATPAYGGDPRDPNVTGFVKQFMPAGMVANTPPNVLFNPDNWFQGQKGSSQAYGSTPTGGYAPVPPGGYTPAYVPQTPYPAQQPAPWSSPKQGYAEPAPPAQVGYDQLMAGCSTPTQQSSACCGQQALSCCDTPPPPPPPMAGCFPPAGPPAYIPPPPPGVGQSPGQTRQKNGTSPKQPVTEAQQPTQRGTRRRTYTVKRGDSLSSIAKKFNRSWQQVYWFNRNRMSHPDTLVVGQKLRIPPRNYKVPAFSYTPLNPTPAPAPSKGTPSKGSPSQSSPPPPPSRGKGAPTQGSTPRPPKNTPTPPKSGPPAYAPPPPSGAQPPDPTQGGSPPPAAPPTQSAPPAQPAPPPAPDAGSPPPAPQPPAGTPTAPPPPPVVQESPDALPPALP